MGETLTLTLLVDKDRNRVVFAESDHRFVDILLSFLALPMATIVRLLDKASSLGSFDSLYKSVDDLDPQFLQSAACKSMLLRPRSVLGARCEGLAINVDDSDHRVYYKCSRSGACRGVSVVPGVECCKCGGRLDVPIMAMGLKGKGEEGVFVRGEGRYTVGDDLTVRPASLGRSFELASRLGIDDGSELEEKVVKVGEEEILRLLKQSLVSRTALSDVFLQVPEIINIKEKSVVTDITQARISQKSKSTNCKRINVKLYLSGENDKVVYAEAGEDLVDLLFSFLTFPLGSVIRLLEKHSSVGCIDNLYTSVELLSNDFGYLKSEDCKNMLLDPMLPPHFGSRQKLLNIDEVSPQKIRTCACQTCDALVFADRCLHGVYYSVYEEMNPKMQNSSLCTREGYAREMVKFMVTDGMEVKPLSPISGFNIIKKLMVPISSLEEAEASLGEIEALNLLKACLLSQTVLSDVFSSHPMKLFEENWCGRLPRKCNDFLG